MQGGTDSSEFRIPDSELGGSVELRVPSPQPSRLTPMPSDKILLPRRMLYVEAVLYATIATVAFGLGYLMGRGGWLPANKEDSDIQNRVPVEGKVLLDGKLGDEGAVIVVLRAEKSPAKRLPIAGLRPDDPPSASDAASSALADLGGAVTQADKSGDFRLFVPAADSYKILILVISKRATPELGKSLEPDLEKYFDSPTSLLKGCRYRWLTKDLRIDTGPINVDANE